MKRNVAICKALSFPRFVEWIVTGYPAIDGDENIFSFRGLAKLHIITEPALDTTALIIIGARTFPSVLIAALEAVDIELTHIITDTVEVLYQLAICHVFTSLSLN